MHHEPRSEDGIMVDGTLNGCTHVGWSSWERFSFRAVSAPLLLQNADQRLIFAEPGHETGSATANEAGNRSWRKDSDLLQRVRRKSVANPLR